MNAIIENIKTRRSIRKFKSDPVPQELIDQVIEAGTYAASGRNRQPWAIIAVTNQEVRERLAKDNASFFDLSMKDPFYNAPVILIVLVKTTVPTRVADGTLALGNMMLAAHSLGLGSCWINRAYEEFEMPEWQEWLKEIGVEGEYEGVGHLALGYADMEPQTLPRKEGRVFYVK